MSAEPQATAQQSEELTVETYRPATDGNVEEVWKGIERAYKIQRQHNREVLRDHVGATTAAALAFSSQLLHLGILNPSPEADFVDDEDESPTNPPQPGTP